MDLHLFRCKEIMKLPTKWTLSQRGEIITAYAHPVISSDCKVIGVVYKPHKSYYLPKTLLDREIYWDDILKQADADAKELKTSKGNKPTQKEVLGWLKMRQEGLSYADIADNLGIKKHRVEYYSRKYRGLVTNG